jgi:hypothetical protein
MTRLIGEWTGEGTLRDMAVTNEYFLRGCLGSVALARVHGALFPEGPALGVPVRAARLWGALVRHPRTFLRAVRDLAELRRSARRILRSLETPQRPADPPASNSA